MLSFFSSFFSRRTQLTSQESSKEEKVFFDAYGPALGRSINFDNNWKFHFGEIPNAGRKLFDGSTWRSIDLPHDYSIEQEFTRKNGNEGESGYLGGGIGWYRKTFSLSKDFDKTKHKAIIQFDGVYMDSTVYINDNLLGNHPYGYTPFAFDITDYLTDNENVIAVRVNHKIPSSRWYSGSGIYRSVNLLIVNKLHIDLFGNKFETPDLQNKLDDVVVVANTEVRNDFDEEKKVTLEYVFNVKEKDGSKGKEFFRFVGEEETAIQPKTADKITNEFRIGKPELWDTENPNLYVITTIVKVNNEVIDTYEDDFGFRYYSFDSNRGFSLNGKNMKLKGVCMHHDQGSIGSIANRDAQERQIKILLEMGVNAIRVTHNPASQSLVDLANKYGVILIEEIFDGWFLPKNQNSCDYARFFEVDVGDNSKLLGSTPEMKWSEFDIKMTLKRDSNSPAIILWSLGNEVGEGTSTGVNSRFVEMQKILYEYGAKYDTSRPFTTGDNQLKIFNPFAIKMAGYTTEAGGVVGMNYNGAFNIDQLHYFHPDWRLYFSETSSSVNSRGVYYKEGSSQSNKELSSYDEVTVAWGKLSSESWFDVIKRDFMAGEFVWTGFDYIGEPTYWNEIDSNEKRDWPNPKNSFFGIVDTAGMPKDRYYFYQSQWNEKVTTLHILPAWDAAALQKKPGSKVRVDVYSNADKVKLILETNDGQRKEWESEMKVFDSNTGLYHYKATGGGSKHRQLYHTFSVEFYEGTLSAEAYNANGERITDTKGICVRKSAGKPHHLKVTVNKKQIPANSKSLAYLQIDVMDENDNIVPSANNLIKTTVTGEGKFLSMDNGRQLDITKFSTPSRQAYSGSVVAIVGSTMNPGKIHVTFESEGLIGAEEEIETVVGSEGPGIQAYVTMAKNYYMTLDSELQLPDKLKLTKSDGSIELKNVVWEPHDKSVINKDGVYKIAGEMEGQLPVSVNVYAIDGVGGVFSYSQSGEKGSLPTLPSALQAFNKYGSESNINVDIKWNMPPVEEFMNNGIITIAGEGKILGTNIPAKATVSIRDKERVYDTNVAPAALRVEEDQKYADTITAVKDEKYDVLDDVEGQANPSIWTNRLPSGGVSDKPEVTLVYSTQTVIGRANVFYVANYLNFEAPKVGATKIFISETGEEQTWEEVEFEEVIKPANERSELHEFTFKDLKGATYIKFNIAATGVTGVVQIELITATEATPVYSDAALESVTINGEKLTEEQIKAGSITIKGDKADIEATSVNNGAVTVLPINKEKIARIVVVAEDKSAKNEFLVKVEGAKLMSIRKDSTDGQKNEKSVNVTFVALISAVSVIVVLAVASAILAYIKNRRSNIQDEYNPIN